MKFSKIAQPQDGYIDIEFIFDGKTGKTSSKIISHGNGASCSLEGGELDERLLDELLLAEVPGFGSCEVEDSGKTAEAFADKKTAPKVKTPSSFDEDDDGGGSKKKEKRKAIDNY